MISSSMKQHIVTAPRDSNNRALNKGIGKRGRKGSVDWSFFRIEKYGKEDEEEKEKERASAREDGEKGEGDEDDDDDDDDDEGRGTIAEPHDHPSLDRITCEN
jgi:phosphopantothenoylcysteine synthetase/decarboxylase